jgi:hypothetical protein
MSRYEGETYFNCFTTRNTSWIDDHQADIGAWSFEEDVWKVMECMLPVLFIYNYVSFRGHLFLWFRPQNVVLERYIFFFKIVKKTISTCVLYSFFPFLRHFPPSYNQNCLTHFPHFTEMARQCMSPLENKWNKLNSSSLMRLRQFKRTHAITLYRPKRFQVFVKRVQVHSWLRTNPRG